MQCAPSWVTLCILKCESGAPETIRTSDHCLRRAVLYPAELRARGADFRTEPSVVRRPLGIHASPLSLVRYALQRISRALAPTPAELRARGADFRTEPSMVWRPLGIHASPLSLVRYALQRISRALAPTPAELRARGADFRTEPSMVWRPLRMLSLLPWSRCGFQHMLQTRSAQMSHVFMNVISIGLHTVLDDLLFALKSLCEDAICHKIRRFHTLPLAKGSGYLHDARSCPRAKPLVTD
jgi:hypothetical protein